MESYIIDSDTTNSSSLFKNLDEVDPQYCITASVPPASRHSPGPLLDFSNETKVFANQTDVLV
jgi:hypothetical protein